MMSNNKLRSDYDNINGADQPAVKRQLKKLADTLIEGAKAITAANKELSNDMTSSKNPKKLDLINKELDDTMDSLRERLSVILDDMKHLTNDPTAKKNIEDLAKKLGEKPLTEKPDNEISKGLEDLKDTLNPKRNQIVKPSLSRDNDRPAEKDNKLNSSLMKTTPRKIMPISTEPIFRRTPSDYPNKENTPSSRVRRMGEPIQSRTYAQPTKQPPTSLAPHYPNTSIRRLEPHNPSQVVTKPFQPGGTPIRSNSVRQIPPSQQYTPYEPKSHSSRNITRLPADGNYLPSQPYYGPYNPSRLVTQPSTTVRKPLTVSPNTNPNIFKAPITTPTTKQYIPQTTPSKQPPPTIRSPIQAPTPRYSPSPTPNSYPTKNITRQPITTTTKNIDQSIELKPMPRPKQKHNEKREIMNSLSPARKSKNSSPSPIKVSPLKISPIPDDSNITNSNIPIDHLSGRTTEANSVKNTLILPEKFDPQFVNGEFVNYF